MSSSTLCVCLLFCLTVIVFVEIVLGILHSLTQVELCDFAAREWRNDTCVVESSVRRALTQQSGKVVRYLKVAAYTLRCINVTGPVAAAPWFEIYGNAARYREFVERPSSSSASVNDTVFALRPLVANAGVPETDALSEWKERAFMLFVEPDLFEGINQKENCRAKAINAPRLEIALIVFASAFFCFFFALCFVLECVNRVTARRREEEFNRATVRARQRQLERLQSRIIGNAAVAETEMHDVSDRAMACHKCKSPRDPSNVACLCCHAVQPDVLRGQAFRFRANTSSDAAGDGKNMCPVCLERFDVGDECVLLPCAHNFHLDCIVAWFDSHDTCPICKQRLSTLCKDTAEILAAASVVTIELILVRYMALGPVTKHAVQIPERCMMEDVRTEISAVVGVDKARLIIATFSQNLIGAWLLDGRSNDDVVNSNGPVLVFETPVRRAQNLLRVQVYHRAHKVFGVPFVLYFPSEGTTALELYELALKHCERYLRVSTESDDSSGESSAPPDDDDEKERASVESAKSDAPDALASAAASLDATGGDALATDETAGYDSARSEAGASVRFPFVLKFVGKDGKTCSQCTRATCAGCVLEPDDTVLPFEKPGAFLAADWKLRDLRRLYRRSSISSVTLDASVAKPREGPKQAKSHRRRKRRR
jgi:hypothetical protein